jgi:23S rRNA (uridine2552-2'-O)-methyltransferase
MTYRRKDAYHRRAQAAGYRARSAYKLADLDRRYRLLGRGHRVVDLGAWPGGWLQVAAERVGPEGRLVGVDLAPIDPLPVANVVLLVGDALDPAIHAAIRTALGGPADVVLSDLAPKLTGVRVTDEARVEALAEGVVAALPSLLAPGGKLLLKTFMGPGFAALRTSLRARFARVDTTRPAATRPGSSELYVVAAGHRGDAVG